MNKVVTFGEIMMRIAPDGFYRLAQALPGRINAMFAGAEANVAVSIAYLGGNSEFVTALPKNAVADACLASLRGLNVETRHILRPDKGRLGIYFLESGANQRPSNVIYDRAGASVSLMNGADYPWKEIFADASWFHVTGITPALSAEAANAALTAVQAAKAAGLTVSSDLNFRKKLWKWDASVSQKELAKRTMSGILPFVDVLIANESDCADVLGIQADNTDAESGKLDTARYPDVARKVVAAFPNIQKVGITLRESFSASNNNWGAMLYQASDDKAYYGPVDVNGNYKPYSIQAIVDRVGGGDSFGAGLIYALNSGGNTCEKKTVNENADEAVFDEYYQKAIEVSILEGFASPSRIQVKLGIGYGRAVKLFNWMVQDQIARKSVQGMPSALLISLQDWEARKQTRNLPTRLCVCSNRRENPSDDYSDPQTAIRFAAAASCLAHSIVGDFNYSTLPEVLNLMGGNVSGRVVR